MHVRDYIQQYYPEYYGWYDYPADRTAAFSGVAGEWGILGNFAPTPLLVDGVSFDCAEKLFQVLKFADEASRKAVYAKKGQHIKMTAKHCEKTGAVRPDWGSVIVDAMKFCLMQKYLQNEAFRAELEKTRGLFIVEAQPNPRRPADTYSAKLSDDGTTWSGPNLMGRLLMELRDNGTLKYRLPDDAVRFHDVSPL